MTGFKNHWSMLSSLPAVTEELKSLKKAKEVEVTVIYPCLFQVYNAS